MGLGPREVEGEVVRPGIMPECRVYADFYDHPYPMKLLLGPRKTLKTTVAQAWMCREQKRDPDLTWLVGGGSLDLPIKTVSIVRAHHEGLAPGSRLAHRECFGVASCSPATKEFFTLPNRTAALASHTMDVFSPTSPQAGGHWDRIVLDNLQNEVNTKSSEVLRDIIESFEHSIPLLTSSPKRQLLVIENIWNHSDLGCRIMGDKREECIARQEPVFVEGEFGRWLVLAIPAGRKRSGRALDYVHLNFPFNLPMEVLEQELRLMRPRLFSAQYELTPITAEDQMFKPEFYETWDRLPTDLDVYIICDPAQSKTADADPSAWVCFGTAKDNTVYELDHWCGHMPLGSWVTMAMAAARRYGATRIGVEETSYSLFVEAEFTRQMRISGQFYSMVKLKHGRKDKRLRAEPVVPRYEAGGLKFHPDKSKRLQSDLYQQLMAFPYSHEDHLPDCIAYLHQMAGWRSGDTTKNQVKKVVDPWAQMLSDYMEPENTETGYRVTDNERFGSFGWE